MVCSPLSVRYNAVKTDCYYYYYSGDDSQSPFLQVRITNVEIVEREESTTIQAMILKTHRLATLSGRTPGFPDSWF